MILLNFIKIWHETKELDKKIIPKRKLYLPRSLGGLHVTPRKFLKGQYMKLWEDF